MRVGYGVAALDVPDGTAMGGYIDRPGPSAGTLDPLRVSAVSWFDGERRFVLVTADVICVNTDLAEWVRLELGHEGIWLAASHTHAGPETGCVPGGGSTPGPWIDRIVEAARSAVHRAVVNEQAADGTAHRGELHGVGADRSRAAAPQVVPLDVVAVWGDGGLAGAVVVLPVHPTVLPAGNLHVSADLVGTVRRALEARLGAGVWVVVATGAAGDISTRHTRQGQDTAELDRLGSIVANRCVELLARPGQRAWSEAGRVAVASAHRTLERASVAADVEALTTDYERARADGDSVAVRLARSRLEGVRARSAPSGVDPIGVDVQVARIGELGLVGLPGEPFLAVAENIRAGRRAPAVVLGYVNGYPGYLPTAQAYARAEYEVLASPVAPGSAELLAETARDLLEEA